MLDYSSLDAVAAVVREGSFERAAAVLSVTPSAISQRVRGLEERVGAILITRGQPCRATAIGARLCAHVEQVRLMEADVTRTLPNFTEAPTATRLTVHVAVNADSLNTWFAPAAAAFAAETGALLNIILEDEAYTAERLRNGDVLAAVTSDPVPVQGCRTMPLGALRYVATASPDFTDRFFSKGTNKETLNAAPMICFNRRDLLQADWAREAFDIELEAPTHWVPATQAFLDMSLAGLGWAVNPEILARPHLAAGQLVEILPGKPLDVKLFWQVTRIGATLLSRLTNAVQTTAYRSLRQT